MKEIKLSFATFTYKKPIVFVKFKDFAKVDVKEVGEMFRACNKLSGNKPFAALVDTTNFANITPEAREASTNKKNTTNLIASAVLVKELGQRLIAKVYKEVNKPPYPREVFDDEKKAIKWLLEQQKKTA